MEYILTLTSLSHQIRMHLLGVGYLFTISCVVMVIQTETGRCTCVCACLPTHKGDQVCIGCEDKPSDPGQSIWKTHSCTFFCTLPTLPISLDYPDFWLPIPGSRFPHQKSWEILICSSVPSFIREAINKWCHLSCDLLFNTVLDA